MRQASFDGRPLDLDIYNRLTEELDRRKVKADQPRVPAVAALVQNAFREQLERDSYLKLSHNPIAARNNVAHVRLPAEHGAAQANVPAGPWRLDAAWPAALVADRTAGSKMQVYSLKTLYAADPEAALAALKDYHPELIKAYPGDGEVEPKEKMIEYLARTDIDWDILLFREGNKIVGGAHTNLFTGPSGERYGAIEQGWCVSKSRKEAVRAFGVATERLLQGGAGVILAEMNDPLLMTDEQKKQDKGRPKFRADNPAFMGAPVAYAHNKGLGFSMPDAKYGQPTLNPKDDPVVHLSLGIIGYSHDVGATISGDRYVDMLRGYFASFARFREEAQAQGITALELVDRDPTFQAIAASARGRELALLPTDAKRSFIP